MRELPPDRYFAYLSWQAIAGMENKSEVVIIQPLGAIEQHGRHLPLVVDTAICLEVLGRALTQLDPGIPAYCLPPLCYGKSNEHIEFPGTITLSAQTLALVLIEVAESIYRAGFRKFALVNAHGGQPQVLEIVARDLRQKYRDFWVFPLFLWRVPNLAAELLSNQELAQGIHAGDAETSAMLAILPKYVDMAQAIAEYAPALGSSLLSLEGALPYAWLTSDLSRSGVLGDPTGATAAKGELLLASLAQGWVQVIEDIYRFKLPL
ncbi:MAG: creatininase family protein [Pseudanabaenaceae cyanobacterium bins.68]|nr:creatininase family protein [Pseudanabaenaceae cyanobacterium bins.68]